MEGPRLLYFLFVTCCLLLASLLCLFKSMGPPFRRVQSAGPWAGLQPGGCSARAGWAAPRASAEPPCLHSLPGNAVLPGETPWKVSRPTAGHQAAPAVQAGRLGEAQLHNFFFFLTNTKESCGKKLTATPQKV